MISRRYFLSGAAALGACAGCRALCSKAAFSQVRVKFGVISDVHVRADGNERFSCEHLIRALEYFRDHRVDGVVIAGDIADCGRRSELKYFAEAWFKVFPNDKAPDGRRVERLFVYGNHDRDGWTWRDKKDLTRPEVIADAIGYSEETLAKAWEECFHEKFEPIWMKEVKGYRFVGRHWGYSEQLGDFLAAHSTELKGKKPFFYIQHDHPGNTVFGTWAWGNDGGKSTKLLAKFPNAVAFSGHSHYTLTDERAVWQGAFTSINTSSMRYSSYDYNLRDNVDSNGFGYKLWQRSRVTPKFDFWDGRQGMLVEVGDTAMRIRRLQFVYGTEALGDDWIVPLYGSEEWPQDYETRAAKRTAPAFASDAQATVELVEATIGKEKRKFISVKFPAAKPVDGCRVFEYEVTAKLIEDDVDIVACQKRVIAPDFHLPPSKCGRVGECRFTLEELPPKARIRFEILPLECFGIKGNAINVEWNGKGDEKS